MRGHLLRPPRPYYIASLICGGPELYTKNSRIMYGEGPIGGCDQGHSSETLSIMWALPAYWRTNPEVYYKNMEAFRWKLTLLRPFDGGMMQNPNRLELMTADPVIGTYIRTSVWITALCAERQNLAITGKPEFQAKSFRKVPPIIDTESRFLNTYVRNWSMVSAALGAKAPGSLKSAIRELKNIPVEQGCRFKLMSVVNARALPRRQSHHGHSRPGPAHQGHLCGNDPGHGRAPSSLNPSGRTTSPSPGNTP